MIYCEIQWRSKTYSSSEVYSDKSEDVVGLWFSTVDIADGVLLCLVDLSYKTGTLTPCTVVQPESTLLTGPDGLFFTEQEDPFYGWGKEETGREVRPTLTVGTLSRSDQRSEIEVSTLRHPLILSPSKWVYTREGTKTCITQRLCIVFLFTYFQFVIRIYTIPVK